jgi:CdiI immunity protein
MNDMEALHQLLGGYLYEDWYLDYGDPWVAVEAFARDEPDYAPFLRADIDLAVAEAASDQELEKRLDKFGLGYAATTAGWESYGAWLLAVADRVDQLLHTSPAA